MKRKDYELEYQKLKAELDEWLKSKNINGVVMIEAKIDTNQPPYEDEKE